MPISPNAPIIEFRADTAPNGVLASIPLTGSGYSGAIIAGTSSNSVLFRIYNNFANTASIHDATNCVLASYDDATHQGAATTPPVVQQWLQVSVTSYNGTTTGGDGTTYYPIGGATKHAIPVNSSVIQGSAPSYIQINIRVVVPALGNTTSNLQGLWLEYSYT